MKLLIFAWLLFFVAHSVMASTSVKTFFEKKLGLTTQTYRLLYNIQSLALIGLVLFALFLSEKTPVFSNLLIFKIIGSILIMNGLYTLKAAFKHINLGSFLGLKAVEIESNGLITEGVYGTIRHPLYWGSTLLLVGLFLLIPYYSILISMIMGILYMAIGIEFEEKKLRNVFGKKYDDFAKDKKKFIPYIY